MACDFHLAPSDLDNDIHVPMVGDMCPLQTACGRYKGPSRGPGTSQVERYEFSYKPGVKCRRVAAAAFSVLLQRQQE